MNQINIHHRQLIPNHGDNDDDNEIEEEPLIEMNFLDDIKGHLEEMSFETNIHDIYDPSFSESHSQKIIVDKNKLQKQKLSTNDKNKNKNNFCQNLELKHSKSLQNEYEYNKDSLSFFKQINYGKQMNKI